MRLSNLSLMPGGEAVDILIEKDIIKSVTEHKDTLGDKQSIVFKDAIVFPGLINSHDHLDFNTFPQLGSRIYNNYVEWGEDIHKQNKDVIDAVLKVPKKLRIEWGIYKNLLNGITTVINHGQKLAVNDNLIRVWQQSHYLHSVQLEKKWKIKLNLPRINKQLFAIHIGEGTDTVSYEEIDRLIKWNLFGRDLIGIHAVAMDERQAANFKALVWCPDSNYFLVGRTAETGRLKHKTKILFGTDSTLSAKWNLWEHLRLARQQKMVTDGELFDMLITTPAEIWNIQGCGKLAPAYSADVVIAMKKHSTDRMDSFFELNPVDIVMVMYKGNIRLFDEDIYPQLSYLQLRDYHKVYLDGKCKYVFGKLPQLIKSIKEYYPEAAFPVSC